MHKVTELAILADVTPDTVRHYVHIGLLRPQRDPDNGYKLFDAGDVKKLRFVKQAQGLGFTLSEIQEILNHADTGESPCPQVRSIIQRRIRENKKRLEALIALQQRMEAALHQWESMPDGLPNGESVCHLIESIIPEESFREKVN